MNTRRITTERVVEGVGNDGVHPRGEKVPIANQQNVNDEVPL